MKPRPAASVLIVDDDPAILKLLSSVLGAAGYEVAEASDGRQAMKLFRERPSDLMITDLIMPDQEGVETITKLRRDYPRLKIIAISGAIGGRYLRVAELLGADTVLQKPFTPQVLLDTVRKLLG